MSLASTAALYNDDFSNLLGSSHGGSNQTNAPVKTSNTRALDQAQEKRRHQRTQKVYPKEAFDSRKVSSMLERIHSSYLGGEDGNEGGDNDDSEDEPSFLFRPPPPPQSMGGTRKARESVVNLASSSSSSSSASPSAEAKESFTVFGGQPKPTFLENSDLEGNLYHSNYPDEKGREAYYRSVMPGYQEGSGSSSPSKSSFKPSAAGNGGGGDVLTQKLNYMIHLLEEQQDQRTGSITEEVVLYSFLGVFIIFMADSFVRVGKYGKYIR